VPQLWHRSVSFRDGMATKKPLAPSMIFKSRMTNMSSNVMLQKACSRSLLPELSSMSLMRTSVISTASTPLRGVRCPGAAGHDPDRSQSEGLKDVRGPTRRGRSAAQPEIGRAAATHRGPVEQQAQVRQGGPDPRQVGPQRLGDGLK